MYVFFILITQERCIFQHDVFLSRRSDNIEFYLPIMSGSYKFNTYWIIDKNVRGRVGGIVDYILMKKSDKL